MQVKWKLCFASPSLPVEAGMWMQYYQICLMIAFAASVLYYLRSCFVALRCFIAPLLSSFPLPVGFQLQWAKSTYLQGEKVRPSFRALGERPAYFLISLWCNSPSFNVPGQMPLLMSLTVCHLKVPDKDKSCHEVSFNIEYVIQISYTRELTYCFNIAR